MTAPRCWATADAIPHGVVVTAPVCSSDTRMRWHRVGATFVQTYPGSHPVTVTAEDMDARSGSAGYVEVQP